MSMMIGTSLVGPDLAAGLLARELRQHQVEDDEVDRLGERRVDGGLAVGRDLDLELVALERVGEAADERRLVVDDEDAWAQLSPCRRPPPVAEASVMRTVVPTDGLGLELDLAAEGADGLAGDREAEAEAAVAVAGAVEAVEDARAVGCRDAAAGVGDLDHDVSRSRAGRAS